MTNYNDQPAKMTRIIGKIPRWALLVAVFLLGFLLRGGGGNGGKHAHSQAPAETTAVARQWTCAMHPQVRQPGPGKCPICAMDLIPASESSGSETQGAGQVRLSESARELASVRTAPVERRSAVHTLRLPGVVTFDERGVEMISARVAGRIDRLYVDFTGMRVRKGQRLAQLYSPELFTAQEELLQAIRSEKLFRDSQLQSVGRTAAATLTAAHRKLELLGMSASQVDKLVKRGKPATHVDIMAPADGTVVEKTAMAGMYVKEGTVLYKISNLNTVWIKLSAYEQDLPWLAVGEVVTFTTPAFPGEKFSGRIDFIDPVVNPKSRTVGVRVTAPNPGKKLKPQMLTSAVVESRPAAGEETELMIPATAALLTGKRAVVYVVVPGERGVFEGRVVELGSRAGDYYLVREGLSEGEMVVASGAFKIDAAAQIAAKPSMMNPDSGGGAGPAILHDHSSMAPPSTTPAANPIAPSSLPDSFTGGLAVLYSAYFAVQKTLAKDDFTLAARAAESFGRVLENVEISNLPAGVHRKWMPLQKKLRDAGEKITSSPDIKTARESFEPLSNAIISTVKNFGGYGSQPLVQFHCPMAFDNRGAQWLQNDSEARNPYFGSVMLRCRDRVDTLFAGGQGNRGPN